VKTKGIHPYLRRGETTPGLVVVAVPVAVAVVVTVVTALVSTVVALIAALVVVVTRTRDFGSAETYHRTERADLEGRGSHRVVVRRGEGIRAVLDQTIVAHAGLVGRAVVFGVGVLGGGRIDLSTLIVHRTADRSRATGDGRSLLHGVTRTDHLTASDSRTRRFGGGITPGLTGKASTTDTSDHSAVGTLIVLGTTGATRIVRERHTGHTESQSNGQHQFLHLHFCLSSRDKCRETLSGKGREKNSLAPLPSELSLQLLYTTKTQIVSFGKHLRILANWICSRTMD